MTTLESISRDFPETFREAVDAVCNAFNIWGFSSYSDYEPDPLDLNNHAYCHVHLLEQQFYHNLSHLPDPGGAIWSQLVGLSRKERLTEEHILQLAKLRGEFVEWLKGLTDPSVRPTPIYASATRELRVGGQLVHKYRQHPADNQTQILSAFQEQRWPDRIEDPLPNGPDGRRLNQTVWDLNKATSGSILFHADGTGEGVTWTFADQHVDRKA